MRRRLHCVIVALLCLTLFVDTATACWYLRQHGRVHGCCGGGWVEPTTTWPGRVTHVVISDRLASDCIAPEGFPWTDGGPETIESLPSQCCAPCDGSAHAVVEEVAAPGHAEQVIVDHGQIDHGAVDRKHVVHDAPGGTMAPTAPAEAVVVHDPTIVVGAGPVATEQLPAVAPTTARPAAPQPQLAAREPLPDLQPATAPAAKPEQPMPASLDLPADAAADDAEAMAKDEPQPAPLRMPVSPGVDDLAGGPAVAPPQVEPKEENLFDEFADEAWDEEADGPADGRAEMPAATTDDDDAAASESSDAPAKEQEKAEEPATEAAASSTIVPDEPMRRWTDATGDHHAQGWLAELRADEVRILKVNGRYTTMAVADLSDDDQAYVAAVAARLAARHARTTETAGL